MNLKSHTMKILRRILIALFCSLIWTVTFFMLGYIQGILSGDVELDFENLDSWGCYTKDYGLFLILPLAAFADIMLDDISSSRGSRLASDSDSRRLLFVILFFVLFVGAYIWAAEKYLGIAFVVFLLLIVTKKTLSYYNIEDAKENRKQIKAI